MVELSSDKNYIFQVQISEVPLHLGYHLREKRRREGGGTTLDPFQYFGSHFLGLAPPTKIRGENAPISNDRVHRVFDPSRLLTISKAPKHQGSRTDRRQRVCDRFSSDVWSAPVDADHYEECTERHVKGGVLSKWRPIAELGWRVVWIKPADRVVVLSVLYVELCMFSNGVTA